MIKTIKTKLQQVNLGGLLKKDVLRKFIISQLFALFAAERVILFLWNIYLRVIMVCKNRYFNNICNLGQ